MDLLINCKQGQGDSARYRWVLAKLVSSGASVWVQIWALSLTHCVKCSGFRTKGDDNMAHLSSSVMRNGELIHWEESLWCVTAVVVTICFKLARVTYHKEAAKDHLCAPVADHHPQFYTRGWKLQKGVRDWRGDFFGIISNWLYWAGIG